MNKFVAHVEFLQNKYVRVMYPLTKYRMFDNKRLPAKIVYNRCKKQLDMFL